MIRSGVIAVCLCLGFATVAAADNDEPRFRMQKLDKSTVVIFDQHSGAFVTCGVGVLEGVGYVYDDADAPDGFDQDDVDLLTEHAGSPAQTAWFEKKYGAGSAGRILEGASRTVGTLDHPAPAACYGWRRAPGTDD